MTIFETQITFDEKAPRKEWIGKRTVYMVLHNKFFGQIYRWQENSSTAQNLQIWNWPIQPLYNRHFWKENFFWVRKSKSSVKITSIYLRFLAGFERISVDEETLIIRRFRWNGCR